MRRRPEYKRFRPKKRPNRYNPNAPDWHAVHSPLHAPSMRLATLRVFNPIRAGNLFDGLFAQLLRKKRKA